MSQLRENVEHIFDCFCEVSIPSTFEERLDLSQIRLKYPSSFEETSILNEVPKFAYPCAVESMAVEHFSFVLLKDLKWLYGFCRCSPPDCSAMVLLSALPWHDLMYKMLDTLHLVLADGGDSQLLQCLTTAYHTPVPTDGDTLHFKLADGTEFSADCPDRRRLPSLLVNRNLTEYWSVVDDNTKLEVFAALLHERHILVTSSRLGRLSACVQAAQALLYPLWWQRIFLPVVPAAHRGCLASPPAFLAGCPSSVVARMRPTDLANDCVRLDADSSRLTTPHRDLQKLPTELVATLRRQLKQAKLGDGVARAFQTAMLQLVGGYRHGIRRPADGPAEFDPNAFLQSQPASRRTFLRTLLNTQMFRQFIEGHLSRPEDSCSDSLVRQPSVQARRAWPRMRNLVGRGVRQRLLSGGPHVSSSVTAPFRGSFVGPAGALQRGPGCCGLPLANTQSAPASPANQRLRPAARPSAPSLLHVAGKRSMTTDLHDRADCTAHQDDPADDPLAGFSPSAGSSLMDEIDAELNRRMSPLGDVSAPRLLADDAAPSGGGDSGSDSDVFSGGASEPPPPRDPGLPPTANGRLPGHADPR